MNERKDINELSSEELENYIHALDILRERSRQDPDDETGYDFQAALHNDAEVGPCEHGNDLFLPWHRAHLHYFERLLQEADPPRTAGVTIPYWDWLRLEDGERKFPQAFYQAGLSSTDRDEEVESLPPDTLKIVLDTPDQQEFGGYPKGTIDKDYGDFELGPHNFMHGNYVGGRMASPARAAEDPIYWSFHGFIDLLWAEWQKRFGDPELTSPDAELRGFEGQHKSQAGEFRRTEELGYLYSLTARLAAAFAVPPPAPEQRQLLWSGPLTPLFSGPLRSSIAAKSTADFELPEPSSEGRQVRVRLDALRVPVSGSYTLRAYLHPRNLALSPGSVDAEQWNVGYVSLWRAHTGHNGHHDSHDHDHHHRHEPMPHHPSSANVRFDVTKVLAGRSPGDMVMTLHYIPAPNRPGQPRTPANLVQEVDLSEVVLEVLG